MTEHDFRPSRPHDMTDLLADRFPGHVMQRLRTPDGRYRYLYVSAGVQKSFGLDPERLMEAEAVDHGWVHPEDRPRFVEALERSAAKLEPLDAEVRVEAPAGGYRWVRSIGQPRRQGDGSTVWDGVALDVTDRREALEALERTLAEARRSEVAEGRFASIAARDLAEPLAELRAAVARVETAGAAESGPLRLGIAQLSETFAAFERAFDAASGLVSSGSSRGGPRGEEPPTAGPEASLTARQREILAEIRMGRPNRAIAERLGISEGTVKLHVSAILKRLGARNRTEAARM